MVNQLLKGTLVSILSTKFYWVHTIHMMIVKRLDFCLKQLKIYFITPHWSFLILASIFIFLSLLLLSNFGPILSYFMPLILQGVPFGFLGAPFWEPLKAHLGALWRHTALGRHSGCQSFGTNPWHTKTYKLKYFHR